ncbi:MAG: sensor histidine kinase [Gemmobacter sp.]
MTRRPGLRMRPSLRMRLWLGAAVLAALAVAAAGIAAYGLTQTQGLTREAMTAQRRIEAYGSLSTRVNEWMLGWLIAARFQTPPDPAAVLAELDRLDRLVAEDVAAAPSATEATLRARQSVTPARLRGLFGQLQDTLAVTPPGTPRGEAAVSFYAAQAPLAVASQIEQETRRRDEAMAAMEALRGPLLWSAAAVGLAAPLVLAALYLMVLQPLFGRLSRATASAEALAMGGLRGDAGGHDELGLMFARLRQMVARIDRRRARLATDYGRLEAIVADRTGALAVANDRLALIDSTRRRFFADVGHELRTPLTVIMGEAELGARQTDPAIRASFETIRARSLRLFRRIEDILRIARSESGQLELQRVRVVLPEVAGAALSDLAPVLRRAGVTVGVDLPPLAVAGDAEWLRQVFAGLFDNAAKYAGRGTAVTVTGRAEGSMALVEVADTGPGLPPGSETAVFQRFGRGAPGVAPGFGVGLALAAWVVEASGGTLAALPGNPGLVLRLTLPLWRED